MPPVSTPTELRDGASRIAPRDPEAALAVARTIRDPWFRAQALATVTEHVAEPRVLEIAWEARAAAARCDDAFGRAAVLRWLVPAAVARGLRGFAAETLQAALATSDTIDHAGSRAEALSLLRQAAAHLGVDEVRSIAARLVALGRTSDHWRVRRAIVRALEELHGLDNGPAEELIGQIADEGLRAKIARRIAGP